MTERKPWNVPFESWVERQIRLAQERGEFDNLAGAGKPLPPIDDSDELWWVKRKLAAEGLSTEALLPPSLQLRREVERLSDVVADLPTEQAVREAVADLNRRIADYLRAPSVPVVPVHKVDADRAVAAWRARRTTR
ncbi:DnaJ family domain-containing protein [Rhodococcus sp. NPDC003322]